MKSLTRKQRKMLLRILVSAVIFFPLLIVKECGFWDFGGNLYIELACFLVPYFIIGYDVLWKAIRNVFRGQFFDECFLMTVATVGALILGFLDGGTTENAESVGVMLFYQVGEFFQSVAVGKSRRSIASLMEIRPDTANLVTDGDDTETVDPAEVRVGSTILVRPGEKIPLDGEIVDGYGVLDTAALTGEALPREVAPGDAVVSGCVNMSGVLRIRTTKEFGESTASKILEIVENSTAAKAKSERFITRFAHYYTPAVVFAALLLALIPPLFHGFDFVPWITRAVTFLVVSCPCALVISVPMSFFGGIGGASKRGILVKGANYLEALAEADTVVFDKTGTLTKGTFSVSEIHPESGISEEALLKIAAHVEYFSNHPIALSLRERCCEALSASEVSEVEEIPGKGVTAVLGGETRYYVGNGRLMDAVGLSVPEAAAVGTVVHVACDKAYLGYIVISDEIKEDAAEAVASLRRVGVKEFVMLTGDRRAVAEAFAKTLSIDTVRAELLPVDKVRLVEELILKKGEKKSLVFVGDGINDAPVLARADVGIAMGAFGSDAAIEASDIVLMDDKPSRIAEAVRIARKTMRIVRQNIVFAIGLKLLVIVLAAFGFASLWLAVFADVGVAVIAILNAMRAMR